MKTEIGGTFDWSEEQAKAYAAAFRYGDAVRVGGEWCMVVMDVSDNWLGFNQRGHSSFSTRNFHRLNRHNIMGYAGIAKGFLKNRVDTPSEIVTPKDYEVREGDKLVWLGETQEYYGRSELTFGKVYDVQKDGVHLIYKTDDTLSILARSEKDRWKFWGVIPRYENVKEVNLKNEETELIEEEEEMNEKTELVDEVEYSGKFKVGDRVKVKAAAFKASEPDIGRNGIISQVSDFETNATYRVVFDEGDFDFFNEAELELVQQKEVSPEQKAFEYLLTLDKTLIEIFLKDEINDWAKEFLKQKDYDSAKQAIEILEKLEESK